MNDHAEAPDLIREAFAAFGWAYYCSDALHRQLANMLAVAPFQRPADIVRGRVEESLRRSAELTLGQLVERTKHLVSQPHHAALEESVPKRNFLAHHFWFERCHLMFTLAGIQQVIEELNKLGNEFHSLDRAITAESEPMWRRVGLTETDEQAALSRVLRGEAMEPLPSLRYPRKLERIVSAWAAPGPSGRITPILESDDGSLWQLTDVGLGWAHVEARDPTWRPIESIQRHLPVNIVARPVCPQPWEYELPLGRTAVLWVTPEGQGGMKRFGVRLSDS